MPDIYRLQLLQVQFAIKTLGADGRAIMLDVSTFPGDIDQLVKLIAENGYRVLAKRGSSFVNGKSSQQVFLECWLDSKHRRYPVIPA